MESPESYLLKKQPHCRSLRPIFVALAPTLVCNHRHWKLSWDRPEATYLMVPCKNSKLLLFEVFYIATSKSVSDQLCSRFSSSVGCYTNRNGFISITLLIIFATSKQIMMLEVFLQLDYNLFSSWCNMLNHVYINYYHPAAVYYFLLKWEKWELCKTYN